MVRYLLLIRSLLFQLDLPTETSKKQLLRTSMSIASLRSKTPRTSKENPLPDFPFQFPSVHKSSALGLFFASTYTIKKEADQLLSTGDVSHSTAGSSTPTPPGSSSSGKPPS